LPEDGIGERIARVRQQKQLTHDGLSQLTKLVDLEKTGIARTTIRGYELAVYKPGSREIRVLAAALQVSPTWLVLGVPEQGESTLPIAGEQGSSAEQAAAQPRIPWAKFVQSFVAFKELDPADKDAICNVILSLARLKIGEVEYRRMMAIFQELVDNFEDGIRDIKEGREFDPKAAAPKLFEAIAKKYNIEIGDYVFPK